MHTSGSHQVHENSGYHRTWAVFPALLSLLLACTHDYQLDSDTWAAAADDDDCPRWACGSNTPQVNNTAVGELNRDGATGNGGFRILLFQHALGQSLELDIEDGELVGADSLGVEHRGADLIDSRIILERLPDLSLYAIVVADLGHVASWTQPVEQVPAYHLRAVALDSVLSPIGASEELCGAVFPAGGSSLLAMYHAVLIDGERYDPRAKTVTASGAGADGWFSIACNGSALAKMKLLGYDPEYTDTATTWRTTPAQRQATLKMITADYCGSGKSFTDVGEPLRWHNASGTATPDPSSPPAVSTESIWTSNGALCLGVPRRQEDEPGIAAAIAAECGAALPPCAAFAGDWRQYGEWRTENPD